MLELAGVTDSDDWWLMRLGMKLGEGLPRLGKLRSYRDGDAMLPEQSWEVAKATYIAFIRRSRLHVVETIRNSRTNRQRVAGFRTAAAGDDLGDAIAWANWKRSNMTVGSRDFFNDVADYGEAFLTVTGSAEAGTGAFAGRYADPLMIPSNGWTTAVETSPTQPHITKAALIVGYDPINRVETATLLRPGYMRIAFRPTLVPTLPTDGTPWMPGAGWSWAGEPMRLGFTDSCPVVRLDTSSGMGVWEKHIDSVDRINEMNLSITTLIVMQAFRQRSISGDLPEVYPPDHPNAGQPIDYDTLFKSGPAALWLLPKDAKMQEAVEANAQPVVAARDAELKNLMAFSGTPHYVLSSDGANQSAQGAALSRETLVFEVEAQNDRNDAALARANSLMFLAQRDMVRAEVGSIETIWKAIDRASIQERAIAAKAAKEGGATQRWIDEHALEMTPAEQLQARSDRSDEAFEAALAGGSSGGS